jgi:hypothetical protein
MTDLSPAPPPELVQQWFWEASELEIPSRCHIATRAAQWAADQELEACCEWVQGYAECGDSLRAARRPKPPSLKELALNALSLVMSQQRGMFDGKPFDTIRRALEALPE